MFTPESLFAMAVKDQDRYDELLKEFPPGTVNRERNDAQERSTHALLCAQWMEKQGLAELANVGPFMTTSLVKRQRVRIRKGSRVFGTFAGGKEGIVLARAQMITVHDLYRGYVFVDQHRQIDPKIVQAEVLWAGSGGYWRRTDINNVEAA